MCGKCSASALACPQQVARCASDIALPHQAFADQERAHAAGREPQQVRVAIDPAFAHQQRAFWRQARESLGGGEIGSSSPPSDRENASFWPRKSASLAS